MFLYENFSGFTKIRTVFPKKYSEPYFLHIYKNPVSIMNPTPTRGAQTTTTGPDSPLCPTCLGTKALNNFSLIYCTAAGSPVVPDGTRWIWICNDCVRQGNAQGEANGRHLLQQYPDGTVN